MGLFSKLFLKHHVFSHSDFAYFHQEQNIIPLFLTYSLPMVKKYFPFAETLALSFLQPMEVLTLTSKGKKIINERECISVHVADNTIPVGRILHLELGSSMHGRLFFPRNVCPVSPILWICPQKDIAIQKPIKIILPHTVKYEEGVSELVFMKVHHKAPLIMSTSTEYEFEFEEIACHEGVEFTERNGSIFTKQFCPVCIVEKVPRPSTKRYLLLRTQPQNCNTTRLSIDYSVMYTLPTCLEVITIVPRHCINPGMAISVASFSDPYVVCAANLSNNWWLRLRSRKDIGGRVLNATEIT